MYNVGKNIFEEWMIERKYIFKIQWNDQMLQHSLPYFIGPAIV